MPIERVVINASPLITLFNSQLACHLLDDAAARRCAISLNISTLGTGGVIVVNPDYTAALTR
ncbi:hypothetical protein [cf. Phormidesmis sp. LEGE 11477]|uniref:hypothetical protein n=1 Tax=cf. Phormidesmis sp. LEGE 11477 TaxID=1828680 RepID=UPI00188141C1|nr:hypothetical protein [cf. Phormidesmis sp. LEGE 11477]MBE9059941.1 hypothetical protein [cf. Phormidesmis sp. LEGE 11477]